MKYLLTVVQIILIGVCLYFILAGNNKLDEAQKTIYKVKEDLRLADRKISTAQDTLQVALQKLESAENELNILRTERQLLDLAYERKKAANWEELQKIKEETQHIWTHFYTEKDW